MQKHIIIFENWQLEELDVKDLLCSVRNKFSLIILHVAV